MRIIVDGFGGDHAPKAVLEGCAMAVAEYGVDITLTGDKTQLTKAAFENSISLDGIEIAQADTVLTMEDDPGDVIKAKKDCSMAVGLSLLAEGKGDAFVSAGNTGALVMGATFIVKRIKGIKRPALAPILPHNNGCFMLMDAGANLECRPEMLEQFGMMGSVYMNKIMGLPKPKVGLINVGAEETKGTQLQHEAYALLKANPQINFAGNVEARELPEGSCEVAVADGFTGNVVLKLTEGLGMMLIDNIKGLFLNGIGGKIAAMCVMSGLKEFKKKMDYTEYGGAPLMGIAKPVIKAHGSSNAKAFKNAIRQARDFVDKRVIEEIESSLQRGRAKQS